jgi:hypothetical protein
MGIRVDKPIEEKESFLWITGYQMACNIQAQTPQVKPPFFQVLNSFG